MINDSKGVKDRDKTQESSINKAISHFTNFIDKSGLSIDKIPEKKRKFSTHRIGHLDFTKDQLNYNSKISEIRNKFTRSFQDNFDSSNQNYINESLGKNFGDVINHLIPDSTNDKLITSLKSNESQSICTVADVFKHFVSSSKNQFGSVDYSSEILDKFTGFCNITSERDFFQEFVNIFIEKSKVSYAKLDISVEGICSAIANILTNSTFSTTSGTYETSIFITKLLKGNSFAINPFISPGFIDIRLLSIFLMLYNSSESIQTKYSKPWNNSLIRANSMQIFKDSILIIGDALVVKEGLLELLVDDFQMIFTDDLESFYDREPITVFITRNRWNHTRLLYYEACRNKIPDVDSIFIEKFLSRRAIFSDFYDVVDVEFSKLNASSKSTKIHHFRKLDVNLSFLIVNPIVTDVIIPHTMIPI